MATPTHDPNFALFGGINKRHVGAVAFALDLIAVAATPKALVARAAHGDQEGRSLRWFEIYHVSTQECVMRWDDRDSARMPTVPDE